MLLPIINLLVCRINNGPLLGQTTGQSFTSMIWVSLSPLLSSGWSLYSRAIRLTCCNIHHVSFVDPFKKCQSFFFQFNDSRTRLKSNSEQQHSILTDMRLAVVGAGISGLVAAYELAVSGGVEVVLYEKEDYLGGHSKTVSIDGIDVDLGFIVFNRVRELTICLFWFYIVDCELIDIIFLVCSGNLSKLDGFLRQARC